MAQNTVEKNITNEQYQQLLEETVQILNDENKELQIENKKLRELIKKHKKLFLYSLVFFIVLFIIQYFILKYTHRGEMLRVQETYIHMYNERLDTIKSIIDKLYFAPIFPQ
jgi:uncharacterized membrane protein YvbJ